MYPDAATPDAALLAAHVAGDPDAFAELVRRHRSRLWAVSLRTLGDPEEAADALQDALLSAFRRADSYRGDAQVTTWLHRIVVNACLDRLRRRRARPADPLPDDDGETTRQLVEPRDQVSDSELQWEIVAALAQLPPEQRGAVVLIDVEGYSVEEAAAILQCPTGTVKSRAFRGRAKLATALAHLRNPDGTAAVTRPDRSADVQGGDVAL
ncbi:MAG: RNA polymerase sigma factor SigM [Actinomycetota bacterium]|nr:MAG: RNA polymerase sigma factor SigM [Actinomycetota bacterium]